MLFSPPNTKRFPNAHDEEMRSSIQDHFVAIKKLLKVDPVIYSYLFTFHCVTWGVIFDGKPRERFVDIKE